MPAIKVNSKASTNRFNIRLDEATASFYKTKANAHGISVSEYLRQTLVQGVISENVEEIDNRLKRTVDEIRNVFKEAGRTALLEEVFLSLFTSEALLAEIVKAREPQKLYEAQDTAKSKLARLTGN